MTLRKSLILMGSVFFGVMVMNSSKVVSVSTSKVQRPLIFSGLPPVRLQGCMNSQGERNGMPRESTIYNIYILIYYNKNNPNDLPVFGRSILGHGRGNDRFLLIHGKTVRWLAQVESVLNPMNWYQSDLRVQTNYWTLLPVGFFFVGYVETIPWICSKSKTNSEDDPRTGCIFYFLDPVRRKTTKKRIWQRFQSHLAGGFRGQTKERQEPEGVDLSFLFLCSLGSSDLLLDDCHDAGHMALW